MTDADLVYSKMITHREYRPDILNLHLRNGKEWQLQEERLTTYCKLRTPSLALTLHLMHTLICDHRLHILARMSIMDLVWVRLSVVLEFQLHYHCLHKVGAITCILTAYLRSPVQIPTSPNGICPSQMEDYLSKRILLHVPRYTEGDMRTPFPALALYCARMFHLVNFGPSESGVSEEKGKAGLDGHKGVPRERG